MQSCDFFMQLNSECTLVMTSLYSLICCRQSVTTPRRNAYAKCHHDNFNLLTTNWELGKKEVFIGGIAAAVVTTTTSLEREVAVMG